MLIGLVDILEDVEYLGEFDDDARYITRRADVIAVVIREKPIQEFRYQFPLAHLQLQYLH